MSDSDKPSRHGTRVGGASRTADVRPSAGQAPTAAPNPGSNKVRTHSADGARSFADLCRRHPERHEQARTFGQRLTVLLMYGNYPAAQRLVVEAEAAMEEQPDVYQCTMADIGLTLRNANALEKYLGIVTVNDARGVTVADLLGVPNFGLKEVEEFQRCLGEAIQKDKQRRAVE
jgi:DNA-directed RNA polymerase alpha subunit